MNANHLKILTNLVSGVNPLTGGTLPSKNIYKDPDIIDALKAAICALDDKKPFPVTSVYKRHNMPWSDAEEQKLVDGFKARKSISLLSNIHQRTECGIRARLKKLGIIDEYFKEYYADVTHFGKSGKYIRSTDNPNKLHGRR